MAELGPQLQGVPAPNLPSLPADPPEPQAPEQPAQPAQQVVHLIWFHFKPEYLGKPDEDTEAHLLCTNDWMTTHHFVEGIKVQRFCSTLLGEARLWYQSLELINIDWQGLQNLFRQQYSKIGNTREQFFMCGDPLTFDKTQNP